MIVQDKVRADRVILDLNGIIDLNGDTLFELCARNKEIRFEKTSKGELIVMLPVGSEGGSRELNLGGALYVWNKQRKLGKVFSSSTGFTLANGAVRSPDGAFVVMDKWKALPLLKRKKFALLCPDFIVELMSETDKLNDLKDKMTEWIENGCRLGWLIDPMDEKAYIYRANGEVQEVSTFDEKLSGEDVLDGFDFDLSELREEVE